MQAQAQKGAHTARSRGRSPSLRDKRPLRGPSWEAKVTGTSAFQIAGMAPGERILDPQPRLLERPQWPRGRAGHQNKPPLKNGTVKELPDED